jgi:hypothetical protein
VAKAAAGEQREIWGTDQYPALGYGVLELLLTRHTWIHRKVETLEFIDEVRVERRVSVDFSLPTWKAYGEALKVLPSGYALIPLASLKKETLRNFDVRDEGGASLPVLTKAQNQRLGFALLIARAITVALANNLPQDLPDDVARDIAVIVSMDNVRTADERRAEFFAKASDGQLRRALNADELFPSLLAELSRDFLLSVLVPCRPGERHIVKYSYEDSLRTHGNIPHFRDRVGKWLLGRTGWAGVELATTVALGTSETHHVEVPAPDELYIQRAQLLATTAEPRILAGDGPSERIHMRSSVRVPTQGLVVLTIRLQPRGVLTAALVVATVNGY